MGVTCDGSGTAIAFTCEGAAQVDQACPVPSDVTGANANACGGTLTTIAATEICTVACDSGTATPATVTCDGSGTAIAFTCEAAVTRRLDDVPKHAAFTVVVDEADMAAINTAFSAADAETTLGGHLETAIGADNFVGITAGSLAAVAAEAHVVSSGSGTTGSSSTSGNSDASGAVGAAGATFALLGIFAGGLLV